MRVIRMGRTAAVAALALASAAVAHDHATGAVKERMDAMESMDKSVKAIKERLRANRDLAAVKKDALSIQAHAAKMTSLFPAGSTQSPTDAKTSLWQNWTDFETKAKALEAESAKLAQTEPGSLDVIRAQFRTMNQVCGGCHKLYRKER
jgi:cytochrome c556